MEIYWSPRSIENLNNIYDFVLRDSEDYAKNEILKIKNTIEYLKNFPDLGHIFLEFGDLNLREIIKNPYRIIYRKKDNILEIVTILRVEKKIEG